MFKFGHLASFMQTFVLVGCLVVLVRTLLWAPFIIPSGSMRPTLLVGDVLLVSKYSYGISRYSIPLSLPVLRKKIFDHVARLGDVIVFRPDHRPNQNWIKRVVGLPGDKVQMLRGILYINGIKCHLEKVEDFSFDQGRELFKYRERINQYIQSLPNGVRHAVIKKAPFGEGSLDDSPLYVVPEKCYFVMGDNRDDSDDSRNVYGLSFVSHDKVLGKALVVFFSTEARWWEFWRWVVGVRGERLLTPIQ